MIKRILFIIVFAAVIATLIWAGAFYWNNLRGVGPALRPAPGNIVDLLEPPVVDPSTGETPAAVNNTDFPLRLPAGFSISIYAKDLGNPRDLEFGPTGSLMVSIPDRGQVVGLIDVDGDGFAEKHEIIADNLNKPHGITSRCDDVVCELYIAETNAVVSFTVDPITKKVAAKKTIARLPAGGRHWTRSLMFRPWPASEELLVSIGSSCDVCHEQDETRGTIMSMKADGSEQKSFATGLRNSVFMAIHPVSGDIWATDMGRDGLGDDLPPDEINIIKNETFYGWPICYGKNIHDTAFDKNTYIRNPCQEPFETPSHIDIPAHSAPLGLAFVPEEGWPEDWWYDLIVAYHGSWNRSEPTGYKLVRYNLDEKGTVLGTEDFVSGWLTPKGALGRPVDIVIQPGGTMFVSDDKAGVVYKISRLTAVGTPDTSTDDVIRVFTPKKDSFVTSPLVVKGEARGTWFFEASFPVSVESEDGVVLAQHYAQAQSEWMTEDFVPFESSIVLPENLPERGVLRLARDNPSGLSEYDQSITIPITFQPRN